MAKVLNIRSCWEMLHHALLRCTNSMDAPSWHTKRARSAQQSGDGNDLLGERRQREILIHRQLAQHAIGVLFGEVFFPHEDAFRALDQLAFGELVARFRELV